MPPFHLTEDAILDIDAIWLYLLKREGLETADRIVTELFKGFDDLTNLPNRGHRRPDLTGRPVLFHRVYSYLIIYSPASEPIQIHAVLHGKRNVARILKRRP